MTCALQAAVQTRQISWNTYAFSVATNAVSGAQAVIWNFDDDTPTASGAHVQHTFARTGDYTVVAEIANANGSVTHAQTSVSMSFFHPGNRSLWYVVSVLAFVALGLGVATARGGR